MPSHILVAEDQADIRDLIVLNLQQAGYVVQAVADGAAALASQADAASDLLVLDLMDTDAMVAARALKRSFVRSAEPVDGYLYLVTRKRGLPGDDPAMFGSSLAGPALSAVAALIVVATLLAVWIIGTVTRPLRVLSSEVAAAQRQGFSTSTALAAPLKRGDDEFAQLRRGFRAMLATLREQWDALKRMDQFRRESVSNLSHDLRSPLTATVACLETLEQRWSARRGEDTRLVQVALRNTHNAAGMVRSHPQQACAGPRAAAIVAAVDVELFERALANVLDNALKFTPAGGRVKLSVKQERMHGHEPADLVQVIVADTGAGIAAAELPHLFDRLYQVRSSVAPTTSDEGKGLGLSIVKRIIELHGGTVDVASAPGQGTRVSIALPAV